MGKDMCMKILYEDECNEEEKCTWYADKERCWKSDKPEMGNNCMKLNEDECIADEKCTWNADKERCRKSDKPGMGKKCMKLNEDECIAEKNAHGMRINNNVGQTTKRKRNAKKKKLRQSVSKRKKVG